MLGVSGKGEAAWSALADVLEGETPACADDLRYVQEPGALSEAELIAMRRACLGCPVLAECRTFSKITRPTGGFWAGRHFPLPHSSADIRERREADTTFGESAAREASQPPGLNRMAAVVSEPPRTIETAADQRTPRAADRKD